MASREPHEHILQACLARSQMLQYSALLVDGVKQRGNGEMRLLHVERDQAIILAHRFDARQGAPCRKRCTVATAYRKLNHVMATEAVDQIGGRAFGDDL